MRSTLNELRELGIDPQVAAEKARSAVNEAVGKDRARQRAALRERMEAVRGRPKVTRDPAMTADQARQQIAQLQAANDDMLTLAAGNRSPEEFSNQEVLDLFWKIEDLKH